MTSQYFDIESISGLHDYVGAPKPKHPLISLIDNTQFYAQCPRELTAFRFGFYTISCKRIQGVLKYGKGHYDFSEGSLMFTAPGQVITGSIEEGGVEEGWALFIHPDLLNATELGKKMHQYSFFNYDVNEALHISDDEKYSSAIAWVKSNGNIPRISTNTRCGSLPATSSCCSTIAIASTTASFTPVRK